MQPKLEHIPTFNSTQFNSKMHLSILPHIQDKQRIKMTHGMKRQDISCGKVQRRAAGELFDFERLINCIELGCLQ